MTTIHLNTGPSWKHPADVVPAMTAFAIGHSQDPALLAWRDRFVGSPTSAADAAARLLVAIGERIRYQRDPAGKQHVWSPTVTVGRGFGDCKKMATLAASLAFGWGIPFRFAVVAQGRPDDPNHVWAELWTGDRWTAVDPVPQPLALGRQVDGRIEEWQAYARKGAKSMQTATIARAATVRKSACWNCQSCALHGIGLGLDLSAIADTGASLASAVGAGDAGQAIDTIKKSVAGSGGNWEDTAKKIAEGACAAALTASGYGAALSPLCKLIGPLWDAIKKWITVKIYPERDFKEAAKLKVPGFSPSTHIVQFYGKDKAKHDAFTSSKLKESWPPAYSWNKHYGEAYQTGSGKGTYYGEVWSIAAAPQEARDRLYRNAAWNLRLLLIPAASAPDEFKKMMADTGATIFSPPEWPRFLDSKAAVDKLRVDAKALTPPVDVPLTAAADSAIGKSENWQALIPMFAGIDAAAPPREDVRIPAAGSGAPPAGGLPSGSRQVAPPTAGRSPASWQQSTSRAPSGSRQVAPPTQSRTSPLPTGSRQVSAPTVVSSRPGWAPGILTSDEASLIAALRQRHGIDVARRASDAARTFGMGAADVRIVDAPTEKRIRDGLPNKDTLLTKTEPKAGGGTVVVGDLKTRAQRTNYGLSHIGEGMTREQAAERLMAFKKAIGADPVDSLVNDDVRGLLAAQGGFPLGAVPTVAAIAAKLPAGPGLPAGSRQVSPPAGASTTGPTPAEARSAGEGLPAGSRQVSPPADAQGTTPPGAGVAPIPGATPPTGTSLPAGEREISPPTTETGTNTFGLVAFGYLLHDAFNKRKAA